MEAGDQTRPPSGASQAASMNRRIPLNAALAFAALALHLPSSARAQHGEPVASGASVGYELAINGATRSERGHAIVLGGVAYEVEGLATLRARRGLVLDAEITARRGSGQGRETVERASVRTEADGVFRLAIDVPERPLSGPQLELVLHREGQPGRRFTFGLSSSADEALDLLTDRNRYQPGEAVRVWTRVRGQRQPAPRAGREVTLQLLDGSRQPVADATATTGPSGVVTAELELADAAPTGAYFVTAQVSGDPPGPSASRTIQVWRRTVERLLAEVQITNADEDGLAMVRPGGQLTGRVHVTTPSGTPVRGATVEIRVRPDADPVSETTDADGDAEFDLRAPSFLSGDVARTQLTARVVHPAHGTITASAAYILTRTTAVVSLTPHGGALVPEVASTLYVSVSDPRGRPLAAGTEVVVRGPGIDGDEVRAAIDDKGFAEVVTTLPRAAASTMRGGPCSGQVAATFEVEVQTDPPRTSRACVRVAPDAEVAVRLTSVPLGSPGDTIEAEVRRRPAARGRPVLVEALFEGRAVAFAWLDARASRGSLELPSDLLGRVTLRARAMRASDAREAAEEPGAIAFGRGAFDALIVRPADAFELSVSPARERYLVRERAEVRLAASPSATGWAALLVRDEAAHGGEGPWDLYWMRGALHEAVRTPSDAVNARMLRASLAASLGLDPEPIKPSPLEPPYWRSMTHVSAYRPGMQSGRGVLRDPIALREELVRRGIARFEVALEQRVHQLGPDPSDRAPIVEGRGRQRFHRDVIDHLVSEHRLNAASSLTLGGEPITVADIEGADPGFDFDHVARRVARARLSKLLLALLRLTDPDQPNAQRASANLPPERWLGTLMQLGMIQASDLTDPWGRPYAFRRVTGRRPTVAVSERALDWELASPGPDGRLGNGDDVNDPFARAVPEGTPYAVASGEDRLMRALASLAPASTVLSRMTQAYQRLSLAAAEERRAGPVTASGSEIADEDLPAAAPEPEPAMAQQMVEGFGRGGGGMPATSRSRRSREQGGDMDDMEAPLEEERAEAEEAQRRPADGRNRADVLGAMIREDFPATLFFAGQVPLENGAATVEVPLADALTTYRLEAIAWTGSGWTTSADARLRVDQRALVDAPVPPFATAGDSVRLPVRVENRTDAPLEVRVRVQAEGIAVRAPEAVAVALEPRQARETLVEVALPEPGEGHLVVSIAHGGEGIDAVRRPIAVLADTRTARDRRTLLVESRREIELEVPGRASELGAGQLRVSVGARLFGDVADPAHPLWAGWALAMGGEPLDEAIAETVLGWVTYEDHDLEELRDPMSSALALAASWRDERLTDGDAARAMRSIAAALPAPEAIRTLEPESVGDTPGWLLLALAPVAGRLEHRPAVRADVETTLETLRRLVSMRGARATNEPTVWAQSGAALALAGGSTDRAREMVRRCDRHLIRVGDMAWLEPELPRGAEPRAIPTALLALAQLGLGRREAALALVRSLVDMLRNAAPMPPPWVREIDILPPPWLAGRARALAGAAASRLAPGAGPAEPTVRLDGRVVAMEAQGATWTAELAGIGRPGTHRLTLELPEGAVALGRLAYRYGMPWDVAPRRRAPIALEVAGELGARDTRAALLLTARNQGPRILTEPVVEIELPAGAELDEPTRELLAAHLRADAHQQGRTLILPLRPLAPGGWVRLPIPARWSLSGTLRGLGAIAYDARGPDEADVLPVAALPSREVSLPDEGPEPERPEVETSDDLPIPPPIPLLERLVPEEG